ncbi:laccase-1 [Rhizoctonia solani AG-1 IA]|uniref:Laccase-1 n=1 Tax=Thanatephorus cucumeris (strain AG1-IA) TaxID=983506 RepID=L8WE35_THACA|nr:laccase-1 [Rhizoctonia solani AG-1 IA]
MMCTDSPVVVVVLRVWQARLRDISADCGPGRETTREKVRGGRPETISSLLPPTSVLALLAHCQLRKSTTGQLGGQIRIKARKMLDGSSTSHSIRASNIPVILGVLLPAAQAALRQHTLMVTNGTSNADGVTRSSWLINGQTPGPHFVWDEGDDVSVTVINKGSEPITVHWHGIEQHGTPWSDGVPGLAQYPIRPASPSFCIILVTYSVSRKMQLDDGLKGTIYIRPDPKKPKPFNQISNDTTVLNQLKNAEINPLMLNVYDYKHYTSEYWMSEWERTDVEQLCIDNIIGMCDFSSTRSVISDFSVAVNGKGQVQCPDMTEINSLAASYQKPLTKKGTKTPFEVFTAKQADANLTFTTTPVLRFGYKVAADGHYTQVQVATSVLIPIGERYQFFVKLDQTPGDYIIRTAAVVMPQLINGYAILSYTSTGATGAGLVSTTALPAAKTPYIDYAGGIINGGVDLVTANLAPYPPTPPPQGKADLTLSLNVTRTGEFGWVLNGMSASPQCSAAPNSAIGNTWQQPADDFTPLLFQPSEVASLDPKVYFSYKNGTLVDLIFTVTAGNPAAHPPHPMHKHGVKAWLLGTGTGAFPYTTIQDAVDAGYSGINIKNPPLRDDFPTPGDITGKAWMAVRFRAVDPGPVILHCHIDPHLATGMVVVLLEGAEKITSGYVPSYYLTKNKP